MVKPKIFIGSSVEGLKIANAIHENLSHDAEITIWNQGVFKLSTPIITNLLDQLNRFDFAIFVFSPDDVVKMREKESSTIRDNVIFETGLFAGKLGIKRVYFVKPQKEEIHLPTDLLGVVAGEYERREDNNMIAATGVFCNQVRQRISELGCIIDPELKKTQDSKSFENDLTMLFAYLEDKNWEMISFSKIKENIHPRLTEDYLMNLIEEFPKAIRRCKIKDGVYGIKWLSKPTE